MTKAELINKKAELTGRLLEASRAEGHESFEKCKDIATEYLGGLRTAITTDKQVEAYIGNMVEAATGPGLDDNTAVSCIHETIKTVMGLAVLK